MTDKLTARLREEPWDDDTRDVIAAVESVLAEDIEGLGAVLRSCDPQGVAITGIKLLAEVIADAERDILACKCHFREWALQAIRRLAV